MNVSRRKLSLGSDCVVQEAEAVVKEFTRYIYAMLNDFSKAWGWLETNSEPAALPRTSFGSPQGVGMDSGTRAI